MSNNPLVVDHTGKRYGRLVALKRVENDKRGNARWLCQCDCGKQKVIAHSGLQKGHTRSCGCLHDEKASERMTALATTHGLTGHPLQRVFHSMHQRCENPNDRGYKNYGGRGIYVCKEWNDMKAFYDWSVENGYDHGLQIDRIDNDGPYAPWNCRWVTAKENAQNTRSCRKVRCINTENGETAEYRSIREAVRHTGVKELTIARMMDGKHTLLKGFKFEEIK